MRRDAKSGKLLSLSLSLSHFANTAVCTGFFLLLLPFSA
jgi:hypothetical protein